MSIDKSAQVGEWEFVNARLLKNSPADLVPVSPDSKEDELFRGFLLTLALLFNDLKNLILLNDTIQDVYKAGTLEINSHYGERFGINTYLVRLLHSTLHEAVVFIRESKDVCDSDRVKNLMARVPEETQMIWNTLRKIAHEKPVDDRRFNSLVKLTHSLKQVRNNVGFHFQTDKQLLRGYRKFFFEDVTSISQNARDWAYRSVKRNDLTVSRYYYADAAIDGYYINLFGGEKNFTQSGKETFDLVNLVMYSIHDILAEYHEGFPNR